MTTEDPSYNGLRPNPAHVKAVAAFALLSLEWEQTNAGIAAKRVEDARQLQRNAAEAAADDAAKMVLGSGIEIGEVTTKAYERVYDCQHPIIQTPVASLGAHLVEVVNCLVPMVRCCQCLVEWDFAEFPLELLPDMDRHCNGIEGWLAAIAGGINLFMERSGPVPIEPVVLDFSRTDGAEHDYPCDAYRIGQPESCPTCYQAGRVLDRQAGDGPDCGCPVSYSVTKCQHGEYACNLCNVEHRIGCPKVRFIIGSDGYPYGPFPPETDE